MGRIPSTELKKSFLNGWSNIDYGTNVNSCNAGVKEGLLNEGLNAISAYKWSCGLNIK